MTSSMLSEFDNLVVNNRAKIIIENYAQWCWRAADAFGNASKRVSQFEA